MVCTSNKAVASRTDVDSHICQVHSVLSQLQSATEPVNSKTKLSVNQTHLFVACTQNSLTNPERPLPKSSTSRPLQSYLSQMQRLVSTPSFVTWFGILTERMKFCISTPST